MSVTLEVEPRSEPEGRGDGRQSTVAISGAGGLVGSSLVDSLEARGCRVLRLVRRRAVGDGEIAYDPSADRIDAQRLEGLDALVHLAGENIAARRWSQVQKRRIRDSRVAGTRLIARTLAELTRPPGVLINASAIGYYGNRGDEILDESSGAGVGFLAETCREWEAQAALAEVAGIRVVLLRTGVVLSRSGGALARMLLPFRLGLGGRIGDGRQFMSWIGIDDLIGVIQRALSTTDFSGPLNAVAPSPVRNAEFVRELSAVLRRPAVVPLPSFAVRLLLGEMGAELLLGSTRVMPQALVRSGFRFRHPELSSALEFLIPRGR